MTGHLILPDDDERRAAAQARFEDVKRFNHRVDVGIKVALALVSIIAIAGVVQLIGDFVWNR
jgi:hypothetical protein